MSFLFLLIWLQAVSLSEIGFWSLTMEGLIEVLSDDFLS